MGFVRLSHNYKGVRMKLNINEIKYIRQSLEHRLIYYESKPQYSQYAEELKPIIKKFKSLEGKSYVEFKKINKQKEGKI